MSKRTFASLFTIIFIAAVLFRAVGLDLRPMHHDEANQALKFGLLLEKENTATTRPTTMGPACIIFRSPSPGGSLEAHWPA